MGCAPSKPKQQPPSPQKRDFREQLVWERSGRKFCEVYELLKDLNSGSFGTVALCRRKLAVAAASAGAVGAWVVCMRLLARREERAATAEAALASAASGGTPPVEFIRKGSRAR